MAKKQTKAIIAARVKQMEELGFTLKGSTYSNQQGNFKVYVDDLEYIPDAPWNEMILKAKEAAIPAIEGEHIEHDEKADEPILAIVPTMDSEKDIKALRENPLVKAIAEFKSKYTGLTFNGLEDKAGIEKVKAAKKVVQKTRIFIKKTEDTLKAPYIKGSKDIKAVADEYRAMIEPIEEPLDKELQRLDDMVNEEIKRKEEEAAKELNRRIDLLKKHGMTFDGSFYVIGDTISMDAATLKAMPLFDFEVLEQKVMKEKERLDNLAAEELKLLKAGRLTLRTSMLMSIGMKLANIASEIGNGYFFTEYLEGLKVGTLTLTDEPDDKFMTMFESLSARINTEKEKVKEEADRKAKERTMALRSKLIIAAGLAKVDWIPGTTQTGFYFKNAFAECRLPLPLVESQTDDEFDALRNLQVNDQITIKSHHVSKAPKYAFAILSPSYVTKGAKLVYKHVQVKGGC